VLLPVLVGFAGIGVEIGLWFAVQRQNQSAADAAAISAALEYAAQIESGVTTNPTAATAAAATTANYNLFSTTSPNTLTLYPCYGFTVGSLSCNTSSSNGTLNAVQAVLTQPLNTAFANFVTAIWGPNVNTVNVTTTAIAAFPQTNSACILALDPSAANAVLVDNASLTNTSCWVAANSSSGGALNCNNCTIAGPTTVGGGDTVSNNGHLNGSPNRTYASPIADPYAATLTHAFLTSGMPQVCTAGPPYPVNSRFCGGLPIGSATTVDLRPGTYWITDGNLTLSGTLKCTSCSPGGAGVTIIFTTTPGSGGTIGTLLSSGNPTITLNAPGSGMNKAGLLMIQDTVPGVIPTDGGTIGGPSATLSGLLYFPSTSLSFVGNIRTDASNCLVTVARSLSLTGNVGLNASGCQTAGLTTLPTVLSVFLAV
jgi:hypothetical protein